MLYMAQASAYGIVVSTGNFKADTEKLKQAHRMEKEFLQCALEFRRSPWDPNNEIWIIKSSKAAAEQLASELPPPAISDLNLDDLGL